MNIFTRKKRQKREIFKKKIYEPTPDVSVIILGGTIRKAEVVGDDDDATVGGDEPGEDEDKDAATGGNGGEAADVDDANVVDVGDELVLLLLVLVIS